MQGSDLGQLLFLLYTSELFFILENELIGYACDRVVSGASFLTGGVFKCDLAHRRS